MVRVITRGGTKGGGGEQRAITPPPPHDFAFLFCLSAQRLFMYADDNNTPTPL